MIIYKKMAMNRYIGLRFRVIFFAHKKNVRTEKMATYNKAKMNESYNIDAWAETWIWTRKRKRSKEKEWKLNVLLLISGFVIQLSTINNNHFSHSYWRSNELLHCQDSCSVDPLWFHWPKQRILLVTRISTRRRTLLRWLDRTRLLEFLYRFLEQY